MDKTMAMGGLLKPIRQDCNADNKHSKCFIMQIIPD